MPEFLQTLQGNMTTQGSPDFDDFLSRLELLVSDHPRLITNVLSNVFTMRLIGNKAHGDLGEIAISEFVNQFMYDFESAHVGKDLFRAKTAEQDILVTCRLSRAEIPISLKAYGDGPLQLSTDKERSLYDRLEAIDGDSLDDASIIQRLFDEDSFVHFQQANVLPLIYREKKLQCNIMVFDAQAARAATKRIVKIRPGERRKHPIWRFEDLNGDYICEVRYGGAAANALQRGLWTHTKNATKYFRSVTNGWIDYQHNLVLVDLFSKALNATQFGHSQALAVIEQDILKLKQETGLV